MAPALVSCKRWTGSAPVGSIGCRWQWSGVSGQQWHCHPTGYAAHPHRVQQRLPVTHAHQPQGWVHRGSWDSSQMACRHGAVHLGWLSVSGCIEAVSHLLSTGLLTAMLLFHLQCGASARPGCSATCWGVSSSPSMRRARYMGGWVCLAGRAAGQGRAGQRAQRGCVRPGSAVRSQPAICTPACRCSAPALTLGALPACAGGSGAHQ